MELLQAKQHLESKKAQFEHHGLTDSEAYQKTVTRLNDLEYHEARTAMTSQQRVREIIRELEVEEEAQHTVEERKDIVHEEISEKVLGRNYNAIFEDPEANKLIHGDMIDIVMGYEQRIAELQAKYNQVTKQALEAENQLAEERNELEGYQAQVNALQDENQTLNEHIGQLNATIMNKDAQIQQLQERIEEEVKDSRFQRNEAARLTLKLQSVEAELDNLRNQKQEFTRNENLDDLAARIKERTEKKKLTNVRQLDRSNYIGEDADGNEVKFNWLEAGKYEQVDQFPEPPALPEIHTENAHESVGQVEAFQDVEPVQEVLDGNEPQDSGDAQPTVGEVETFEEWARREINELKAAVFGVNKAA